MKEQAFEPTELGWHPLLGLTRQVTWNTFLHPSHSLLTHDPGYRVSFLTPPHVQVHTFFLSQVTQPRKDQSGSEADLLSKALYNWSKEHKKTSATRLQKKKKR